MTDGCSVSVSILLFKALFGILFALIWLFHELRVESPAGLLDAQLVQELARC